MDRSAVFVDAGYLLASAGRLLYGTRTRTSLRCEVASLVPELANLATANGARLLRTYWYDGAKNGIPHVEHEEIGNLPYVKVRLGRLVDYQQKGVDSLIYKDLMTLAREHAITQAYLLSGDEDLREGVLAAQDMGVQVTLLGIPPTSRANQSHTLIREADNHRVLPKAFWELMSA